MKKRHLAIIVVILLAFVDILLMDWLSHSWLDALFSICLLLSGQLMIILYYEFRLDKKHSQEG